MTPTLTHLRQLVAFDEDAKFDELLRAFPNKDAYDVSTLHLRRGRLFGAREENARLQPAIEALLELLPAATKAQAMIRHALDLDYFAEGGSTERWARECHAELTEALRGLEELK